MTDRAKKRIATVSVTVLLILSLLTGYYFWAVKNSTELGSGLTVDEEARSLGFSGETVRILQLSDVQTSNLVESAIAYPMAERIIERTRPDLIVLTGDNISNGSNEAVLKTFIGFMDSFGIPWALVFGNHDIRSAVPPAEQCAAYESSKYCIFSQGTIDGRYGNYYYTLKSGDEATLSLIFMDSADSSFTAEQVAWYRETVTHIADEEGRTVPSLAFFHIPIAETADAHAAYALDPSIGSGTQVDEVRTQAQNGFFDAISERGSTRGLFYGHDHRNNTFISYRGVSFCYATKTGRTVYYEPSSLGGNLITVYTDGSFDVERITD